MVNAIHWPSEYSYQSWWMACAEPRIVYDKPFKWPSQSLWLLHETWWVASAEVRSVYGFHVYLCISEVFRRTNYFMKFIYILRLLFSGMWHCIELLGCFCQYAATCLWTMWHHLPEVNSHCTSEPQIVCPPYLKSVNNSNFMYFLLYVFNTHILAHAVQFPL